MQVIFTIKITATSLVTSAFGPDDSSFQHTAHF